MWGDFIKRFRERMLSWDSSTDVYQLSKVIPRHAVKFQEEFHRLTNFIFAATFIHSWGTPWEMVGRQ